MSLIEKSAAGAFHALSRARGRRVVHPHGAGFRATLTVGKDGTRVLGAGVFGAEGSSESIVRLSRGAGVPRSLPDVLGLALRVPDTYGDGAHQDLLMVSSSPPPVLRHTILPGPRGFFKHFYSTVAPFHAGGSLYVLGARCMDPGPSPSAVEDLGQAAPGRRFELVAARPTGGWREIAELEIGEQLPMGMIESMRFNPWNTSPELEPRGPFMRLRDPAYRASQAGRGETGS